MYERTFSKFKKDISDFLLSIFWERKWGERVGRATKVPGDLNHGFGPCQLLSHKDVVVLMNWWTSFTTPHKTAHWHGNNYSEATALRWHIPLQLPPWLQVSPARCWCHSALQQHRLSHLRNIRSLIQGHQTPSLQGKGAENHNSKNPYQLKGLKGPMCCTCILLALWDLFQM